MSGKKAQAILYIGGSYPQLPGIRAARELGLHVVLTDRSAEAPGKTVVDRFEKIDATDVQSLLVLAEDVTSAFDLVGVYGVADYAYVAIGEICEALGLKSGTREAYRKTTDKRISKALWSAAGLPVPATIWAADQIPTEADIDEILGSKTFPAIVKPGTSNNSKGVTLLREADRAALRSALTRVGQESDAVLVEEFVTGRIFNVDGLMIEGELYPVSITERGLLDGTDTCQPLFSIQPAPLPEVDAAPFYDLAGRAATALGFHSGPFTVDVIVGAEGPRLLELSPHFHSIKTEVMRGNAGPFKAWWAYLMGEPAWARYLRPADSCFAAYLQLYSDKAGTVRAVTGLDEIMAEPEVVDVYLLRDIGSVIHNANGYRDVCGVVWLKSDSYRDTRAAVDRVGKRVSFQTD